MKRWVSIVLFTALVPAMLLAFGGFPFLGILLAFLITYGLLVISQLQLMNREETLQDYRETIIHLIGNQVNRIKEKNEKKKN